MRTRAMMKRADAQGVEWKEWLTACLSSRTLAQYSTDRYAGGLYFRVREGTGCCPAALAVIPKHGISVKYLKLSDESELTRLKIVRDTLLRPFGDYIPMGFFTRRKEKKEEKQAESTPKAPEPKVESKASEPKPAAESTEKAEKTQKKGAYFVSPRPDGRWQVKRANSEKILKIFDTKVEAEEYAKRVAANQGSTVVRQKKDGKIQKKK